MNVLLINPKAPNIARISLGFDLKIGNIGRFPPVGLISLASFIRRYSKHNIAVIDCDAVSISFDTLRKHIKEKHIDVVGITSFTYTFYDVLALTRIIKKECPEVIIVLGGPHTLLFPRETLSHPEIDYLVIGEGEEPFLNLLNTVEKKGKFQDTRGIAFRNNNDIFIGEMSWVGDLDGLPFPAYDLLSADSYHSTFGYGGKTITLCSSRGCPYHCTYCQKVTKGYRAHSIPYLIEYMKSFYNQGYRNFYFFDDTFTIEESRVMEFSKKIREENMDIKWIFRGRVNTMSKELCREASLAGCVQILLGIEDYTNEGLMKIKKNITIEQAKDAVANAKSYGIRTSTNWILGLPTHKSWKELQELVNTAININSDYAMFTILQLLPGCEMFDEAVEEGAINRNSWSDYVLNPVPSYQIEFYDKYLSGQELSRFYALAHKKFYRRPGYIIRRILDIRSLSDLKNKLPVALNVLFPKED